MKRTKEGKDHGEPHVPPLPTQAVALLRDLVPVPGGGHLVFPGQRSHDRPISDNSLRTALSDLRQIAAHRVAVDGLWAAIPDMARLSCHRPHHAG